MTLRSCMATNSGSLRAISAQRRAVEAVSAASNRSSSLRCTGTWEYTVRPSTARRSNTRETASMVVLGARKNRPSDLPAAALIAVLTRSVPRPTLMQQSPEDQTARWGTIATSATQRWKRKTHSVPQFWHRENTRADARKRCRADRPIPCSSPARHYVEYRAR